MYRKKDAERKCDNQFGRTRAGKSSVMNYRQGNRFHCLHSVSVRNTLNEADNTN